MCIYIFIHIYIYIYVQLHFSATHRSLNGLPEVASLLDAVRFEAESPKFLVSPFSIFTVYSTTYYFLHVYCLLFVLIIFIITSIMSIIDVILIAIYCYCCCFFLSTQPVRTSLATAYPEQPAV